MSAGNWITLVLPILGFVFGSILYVLQKRMDRENEERRERRELYRNSSLVLQRVHNLLRYRRADEAEVAHGIEKLEEVIAEIQVTAPDNVAESWNVLPFLASKVVAYANAKTIEEDRLFDAEQNFLKFKAAAISSMRNDTFEKTGITLARVTEVLEEFEKMTDVLRRITRIF